MKYLGHNVSAEGIVPLKANKDKIINFKTLDSKIALRRFLGVVNFYHPFLRGLASILKPRTDLSSPKIKFLWTQACDYAFNQAKEVVNKIPTLSFPLDDAPTRLSTNACDVRCGAVLEQFSEGSWVPIKFSQQSSCSKRKTILHLRPGATGSLFGRPPFPLVPDSKKIHSVH